MFRKLISNITESLTFGKFRKGLFLILKRIVKLLTGIDLMYLYGEFELIHSRDGVVKTRLVKNLVTSAGKAAVAGLINGVITNFFDYIAIGTGTTAANVADTALETEISTNGGARAASTNTRITTSVTNDTAQCELTYTFSGSFAVTEAGLLDSSSTGTLLCRQVFSAVNVVSGDQLTIRWKIQVS